MLVTNRMKKYLGRERPPNPKLVKGTSYKPRIVDIRSMENNKSFPSGDSAQGGAFAMFMVLNFPLILESWGGKGAALAITFGT